MQIFSKCILYLRHYNKSTIVVVKLDSDISRLYYGIQDYTTNSVTITCTILLLQRFCFRNLYLLAHKRYYIIWCTLYGINI